METFVDWLSNESLPWAAYRAFISGRLIVLNKQPGARPVVIGEMWRRLFSNIALKATEPEATVLCHYDHMCSRLKAGIYGTIHRLKSLWDKKPTMEE